MKNSIEKISHKTWWKSPSKATDTNEHRVVSTIELFCDIVFVAYIAAITHVLSSHITLLNAIEFIILFTIGWLIWLNSAQYHDIHGNNDLKTRFATFLQMILIGLMAVFSHHVRGESYLGFALSFSGIVFLLGLLWRETGIADPSHAKFSKPYSVIYFILGLLILISVFLDDMYRLDYLTFFAFLLVFPMLTNYFIGDEASKRDYLSRLKLSNAFIERSNLYFIIVLGEIIIGALNGFSNVAISVNAIGMLFFNFIIAFSMWFNHFEFIGHIQHKESVGGYFLWLLSFYVETMMMALLGSVVYSNYGEFSIALLAIPSIIFFLATIVHVSFNKEMANPNINIEAGKLRYYISLSIILIVLTFFSIPLVLKTILLVVALYIPMVMAIKNWMG